MTTPLTVLHVDDDDDIREIALLALETVGGLNVTQCASGAEALKAVKGMSPDVFLLDVMMPEMSGEQLFAALRAMPEYAHVPTIFMTARVQPDEIVGFKELGAVDVIEKPFDPMALSDRVIQLVEKAKA
ncbi:response regulator [Sulfitobacter sabulilitoris]|uniref:Response regulator n=1 Tax=Sulfitobacter sabulilitoris TaxID=2562655 RepID=A0A5S3PK54_9RHOB|nr:response regulator [Sulfitobacter sabulilitoris]TMM54636.1 response regulator [Sulfitobacter sabulilitoris]